jgi:hypothetical protein
MMGNSRQFRNSRQAGAVSLPGSRLPQQLLAAAVLLAVGMLAPRLLIEYYKQL